ncbi:hypothetical protein VNO78_19252 [Psophocarpus tetragonolobus]|uniref:Magnesium transporter n=1 Tax=Psophocarpus tetragonolobus TaxID=3891 RepID=A0AAN9SBR5_PSOTE
MLGRKGTGARTWLMLDGEGQRKVMEARKHVIMQRTGLSARDLRVLDPLLSYPSTIVGRESAMVINLEHIKAIITAHQVLLLNSTEPTVDESGAEGAEGPKIGRDLGGRPKRDLRRDLGAETRSLPRSGRARRDLRRDLGVRGAISAVIWARETRSPPRSASDRNAVVEARPSLSALHPGGTAPKVRYGRAGTSGRPAAEARAPAGDCRQMTQPPPRRCSVPFVEHLHQRILSHHAATQPQPQEDQDGDETRQDGINILPFEFVTLEACLEAACSALELIFLQAQILEKETYPALDRLTSKISTLNLERIRRVKSRLVDLSARVWDELEHLLDDNEDMAELYLTKKSPPEIPLERGKDSANDHEDDQNATDHSGGQMFGASNRHGSEIREIQAGTICSAVNKHSFDVEELEMLLGAYFVQIGCTLNKLSRLKEYVDDTEDYINIALDEKQNRLLQMGVKLGTTCMLVNAFVCECQMPQFLGTIFGSTVACLVLYVVAIIWYKHKGLVD